MLRVLFLLSLTFTFAWENFRVRGINGVSNTTALSTCFSAGLCTLNAGCCTGHGTCQVDASGNATCVCDKPQECRQGATINNYSGKLCDTYASQDCCTSGSSDLIFSSNGGCHLVGADATPEKGAKGNLLKRDGAALFSDANGITDPQLNLTQIDQMIAVMNATSRGTNKTKGNMMGLGFLEFALKDVVDFAYNYSNTVTLYGVTYPKVQWQQNTGIKVGNVSIPKQFENTATAVIDVGPLYDYATRIGSTPYLNLTGALVHWQNVLHMPFEFITALKFYNAYHYYAARNYEEFFCGQNSNNNPSFTASACQPIRSSFTSDQALMDWFFQQARRSTIRFSQAIIEHSVLQILLSYNGNSLGTSMYGFYDVWFEGWFRRDVTVATGTGPAPPGAGAASVPMGPSVRLHQEWAGDVTRANLTQHLISGLDFLISLRNPVFNYSASSWLNNTNIEGFGGTIPSALAFDVVALTHTQLQNYGSKVASNYTADLALQLYRVGELGLASYKTHIGCLTNQSTTGVSDLSQDYNVYYGAQIETNRSRQYMNTTASVAMASVVPINDVLIVDRVSYWAYDVNYIWTGINYHPDPQFITLPAYDFQNCFNGCDQSVETVSSNAAMVVLGYNPEMDVCVTEDCSEMENIPYWRSNGVTYPQPDPSGIQPALSYNPVTPDFTWRQNNMWRVAPDFLNALYYKYDGLNTLAVHYSGSSTHYLPNQLVDSIPVNIGFNDINMDGFCYTPSILAPTITRVASDMWDTQVCLWSFPYIME